MQLQETITKYFNMDASSLHRDEVLPFVEELKRLLNKGEVRSAELIDGEWKVNEWVKQGILLGFRIGTLVDVSINEQFRYFDKDVFPLKHLTLESGIRQVPGGSSIRDGCYVAKGVVIMPPAYINIGSYVDDATMIDSHALVGSCAQIGKRVHLSAAAQIGGVLEPVGMLPVIIEDDVIIGGNCGVFEGVIVKKGAIIAAGTVITSSTPVYDVVRKEVYRKSFNKPLIIPEDAVVVSGGRKISGMWAEKMNLDIYTPIIIKYRDDKTATSTQLEESLHH